MSRAGCWIGLCIVAGLTLFESANASVEEIKTVFVIAMENHNWTQPNNKFSGGIQQIYQNPDAPFINNLVNGSAFALINGNPAGHLPRWALSERCGDAIDLSDLFKPGVVPKKP